VIIVWRAGTHSAPDDGVGVGVGVAVGVGVGVGVAVCVGVGLGVGVGVGVAVCVGVGVAVCVGVGVGVGVVVCVGVGLGVADGLASGVGVGVDVGVAVGVAVGVMLTEGDGSGKDADGVGLTVTARLLDPKSWTSTVSTDGRPQDFGMTAVVIPRALKRRRRPGLCGPEGEGFSCNGCLFSDSAIES
jgi:hypothetical protein